MRQAANFSSPNWDPLVESNRILGVSTAQWRQVDLQTQLQTTRLDAEGADRRCFGIEQSIFAAPHTPWIRLLSACSACPRNATL